MQNALCLEIEVKAKKRRSNSHIFEWSKNGRIVNAHTMSTVCTSVTRQQGMSFQEVKNLSGGI